VKKGEKMGLERKGQRDRERERESEKQRKKHIKANLHHLQQVLVYTHTPISLKHTNPNQPNPPIIVLLLPQKVLHKFSVDLPKKHGRGGQSALRFARLRLEKRQNYVTKVFVADYFCCDLRSHYPLPNTITNSNL
jgi:hypothetical protein